MPPRRPHLSPRSPWSGVGWEPERGPGSGQALVWPTRGAVQVPGSSGPLTRRRGDCGACVGLLCSAWSYAPPSAAETHLQSSPTTDNPKIRKSDNRPNTKKQRKTINPKQGKAKPGPPSHGEMAMALDNGMPRCRSKCQRNVKISNRGSAPRSQQ